MCLAHLWTGAAGTPPLRIRGLLWHGTVVLAEEGKECRMSLLGWLVGAALVDEWDRREEEEEARKDAERKLQELRRQNDANERKIRRLEADLKALKGRGRGGR